MNQAHLHLLLNHLPIVGLLIGILILSAGLFLKSGPIKRTALGVFVFSALFAIPAYLTGEGAEEVAENLPGVREAMIGEHEELANFFLAMTGILGVLSLFTLFADLRAQKMSSTLYIAALVLALGTMAMAAKVGSSGGAIRHTEISSGITAGENGGTEGGEGGEKDDDD